jgi:uncharacterized protein (DUF58 family)
MSSSSSSPPTPPPPPKQRNAGGPSWSRTRLSPAALSLAVFAAVLFTAGLFAAQPLIFISVPLVSLLGFMILRSRRPVGKDVEVSRMLERSQIRENDGCSVGLRVTNTGPRDIPMLQIRDLIPSELDGDATENGFTVSLKAGETRELYYRIEGRSFGVFSIGPTLLSMQDASGLVETEMAISDQHTELVVLPETAGRITGFPIRPRKTKPWPGGVPARRNGTGMDLYNVRMLSPDEPVRRINWRASARAPGDGSAFFTNEYTAELGTEVLIVLDMGRSLGEGGVRHPIDGYSAGAALSIGERLLRDKNRVGLLTVGPASRRVAPGFGRRQFDRIAISIARTKSERSSSSLSMVGYAVRSFFPSTSQLLFISPLMDDAAFNAAAELARAGEYDLMIVSPDPLRLPHERADTIMRSRAGVLGSALARLERSASLGRLQATGAWTVDWDVSEPLEKVLAVNRRVMARYGLRQVRR